MVARTYHYCRILVVGRHQNAEGSNNLLMHHQSQVVPRIIMSSSLTPLNIVEVRRWREISEAEAAITEEAILRRAMIGSLIAANRREKKSGSMRANQFFCFLSGGGGLRGVTSRSADIFTLNFIQALIS